MSLEHIWHLIVDNAVGLFVRYLLGALVMTGAAQLVIKFGFRQLKQRREIVGFWIGGVVLFSALIYWLGTPSQAPNLVGAVQQAALGPSSNNSRDTIAVLALNIINTGSMQTIVKNWKVEAITQGNTYSATFAQMPPQFTFKDLPRVTLNQPTSITYFASDNIVEKSLIPIQVGALLPGILFVVFQNVDQTIFRGVVTFNVIFEDVLSRVYTVSAKSNGQIGQMGTMPGLKTEMACPVPPAGIPKIGNDLLKSMP